MTWRYKAFLSYAHRDAAAVGWLHRRLETYRAPKPQHGVEQKPQLKPVFRDREELPASGNLGSQLTQALENSEFLIVVCSPAAAKSHWVGEEIRHFRRTRGAGNILAFIVDGEPHSGGDDECFPPALLEPDDDGAPVEPIAADARPTKDGRRLAFLKLAAGLLGRDLDALVQRDAARRTKRLMAMATASTIGMVFALGLTFYANQQRVTAVEQRQLAQKNARTAEATVDYLIDTFGIANPATENPRTITALTILERGAEGIDTLGGEPEVQAELYGAVGDIYRNLGLYGDAAVMLDEAQAKLEPGTREAVMVALKIAANAVRMADFEKAQRILDEQEPYLRDLGARAPYFRGQAERIRAQMLKAELKTDEAIEAYVSARKAFQAARGDERETIAAIGENLATTYQIAGDLDKAEEEYLNALEIRRELHPAGHKSVAASLNNLAYFYFHAGDIKRAKEFIEESIEIKARVLDAGHPSLADAQMMFGQILERENNYEAAQDQYARSREGLKLAYPGGHYKIGFAAVHLASVKGKLGETDTAMELLDEAVRQYDVGYGGLHANHGDLEVYRAEILMRAGRADEARAACSKAETILGETIGPDAAPTIELMNRCRAFGAI